MSIQDANWQDWQKAHINSLDELDSKIQHAYDMLVSKRTGVIHSFFERRRGKNSTLPFWLVNAKTANFSRYGYEAHGSWRVGSGFGLSRSEAIISALGEGVERYSACILNEEDVFYSSFNRLTSEAISPEKFTLCSEQELLRFQDTMSRFDPDVDIGWVNGQRLPNLENVAIPASLVFASYKPTKHEHFMPAISTGLASGLDFSSAILGGLLECIERDAYMITYLNRLPVKEIDLNSIQDSTIQDILKRIPPWAGFKLRAWDMTTDIGIPCVLSIAQGLQVPPSPALAAGAAAHVNAIHALRKALLEAIHDWIWVSADSFENSRNRVFAPDYSDILTRDDHLAMATQSRYLPTLDWLLNKTKVAPFAHSDQHIGQTTTDSMLNVIQALEKVNLRPIVVNLTSNDVAVAGFKVCRVLVPGLQPMMFGPIRLLGGQRLYEVPKILNYTQENTTEDSLNNTPHFFP